MGPALAKAFAGFKVVAIRADQVGFAVFLALLQIVGGDKLIIPFC